MYKAALTASMTFRTTGSATVASAAPSPAIAIASPLQPGTSSAALSFTVPTLKLHARGLDAINAQGLDDVDSEALRPGPLSQDMVYDDDD